MGDRMVLVSRKQTNRAAEKSCRRAAEGGHAGADADAERTHSDGALADDVLANADAHADDADADADADAHAHADAAAKDIQESDNMERDRDEEQKRNNGHAGAGAGADAERTHSDGALAEAKRNNIASGLGDGHAEEEEDEEHFTVRETMHVRYGDLILPEMEEEELKGEGGSARAPLDGGSSGAGGGGSGGRDMLVCRACCFPIVLADAAEEPMALGIDSFLFC